MTCRVVSFMTVLFAALLFMTSCDSLNKASNMLANPAQAIAGDWNVTTLGNREVASMLPDGAQLPSLTIGADGSVNGFGGVNRLTSALKLDALAQGKFDLSQIASTRMAGPPAAMDVESKLIKALEDTTGFRLDGDRLQLERDEATLLEMERAAGG